jgi:hypothetical protein
VDHGEAAANVEVIVMASKVALLTVVLEAVVVFEVDLEVVVLRGISREHFGAIMKAVEAVLAQVVQKTLAVDDLGGIVTTEDHRRPS